MSQRKSWLLRAAVTFLTLVLNGLAVSLLWLYGTGFEIHDTPDGVAYHRLTRESKLLLATLLLSNLGIVGYLRATQQQQSAFWFGLGALLPMLVVLLSVWKG